MQIEFEVLGKVKAKQSCRMTRDGIKYTPADVKSYANWVRLSFMQKYPDWLPSTFNDTPLMVEIDAYFIIPKSFSKTKKQMASDGFIRPTVKPDCDNMADYGIIVHRERDAITRELLNQPQICVAKVKNFSLGNPSGGTITLNYNANKRILENKRSF